MFILPQQKIWKAILIKRTYNKTHFLFDILTNWSMLLEIPDQAQSSKSAMRYDLYVTK